MAFNTWSSKHLAKFNSHASCKLIDIYTNQLEMMLKADASRPPHHTFAASQFRCDRLSWFRLTGVQPDKVDDVDTTLSFIADTGTACHKRMQRILKEGLGVDWINVDEHIKQCGFNYEYTIKSDDDNLEHLIEIKNPPIRFACDGIITIEGKKYLLEIKSSELSSFQDLTSPKPQHLDQVKLYATLLGLDNVLFVYQDRQYGEVKSFEIAVTQPEKDEVWEKINRVMRMAEAGIAPDGLPIGDSWCTKSMCPFYEKCKAYGRM